MVQLTGATLLAIIGAAAAGSAHRNPAHAALHQRGNKGGYTTETPVEYSTTWAISSMPSDTTCTEEESTTPAGSTSTYVVSTPSTYAVSTPSTYPAASSTYPAASSSTTCTEEESSSTYVATSPAQSTYVASTPAASYSTYEASTPEASTYEASTYEASTYEASTYVESSTYVETTPVAKKTTTSYKVVTSVALYTVTGGTPEVSSVPAAASEGAPEGGCGTVTVTVTAGQAAPSKGKKSKGKPSAPATTYEASTPEASTYEASTYEASTYVAETTSAAKTYAASTPAATYAAHTPAANAAPIAGKRGIAYASIPTLNVGEATGIAWAWNWSPSPTGVPESVQFVPILKDTSMVEEFQQAAKSATYLMAMNEVDMTVGGGGSPMTPQEAAAAYKQYMMPYAGTCKLGSVSVTSDNSENSNLNGMTAASGLDYLSQFAQACTGCQIDFACVHWYGLTGQSASEQAQAFQQYIQQAIETVQQLWGSDTKIWITEFSALPEINEDTAGVNEEFMKTVLPWLDSQDSVERYSYYAAIPGLLANSDGSLTELGQTYASA